MVRRALLHYSEEHPAQGRHDIGSLTADLHPRALPNPNSASTRSLFGGDEAGSQQGILAGAPKAYATALGEVERIGALDRMREFDSLPGS